MNQEVYEIINFGVLISEWMARCNDKVVLRSLTADGSSAAAAPTWIASYGCPGSYPFLPSPARNHGQHKVNPRKSES